MTYPKISIVTPSFNQGKYIEQTIRSVIDQKYPNLEYIIMDGGSTDNTVDILKKYEEHLTYWVSEPDKGQTDAINKGFAKCTGEIFNWINSDDYYEPVTFHTLAQLFSTNPSVNIVCGKEWGFNDDDPADKILHAGTIIKENVFETIRIGIIDQPCTFFRRAYITSFFPLDISLRYVMDRQLWWSYLLKYGQDAVLITNTVFTNFRIHPQAKSTSEADLFEAEFDRMKLSLFEQLGAPVILQQQLHPNIAPVNKVWEIMVKPTQHIAAAFATSYAVRYYVQGDLIMVAKLMQWIKKWKQFSMTKTEWKLWLLSTVVPAGIVRRIKKLRKGLSF